MQNVPYINGNNVRRVRNRKEVKNAENQVMINPQKPQMLGTSDTLWTSMAVMSNINRVGIGHYQVKLANSDGIIGDFKQGAAGNCWMLSGLKSLSCTPRGAQIIKDAVTKNDDGSITINFKGLNTSYTITEEEFKNAKEEYLTSPDGVKEQKYSSGDVDAMVFELAVEKIRRDLSSGRYKDADVPNYAKIVVDKENPIDGGVQGQLYYLLTGKHSCGISLNDTITPDGEVLCKNNKEKADEFLNKYSMDPKKYAAGIAVKDAIDVRDITGNKVHLTGKHAYALEGMFGNNVIISDPHNSARKIILPRETFLRVTDSLNYQNLKDDKDPFDEELKQQLIKQTDADNYMNEHC